MHQEILQTLGLTPNEAKIYEFLVEHGESGVSQIANGGGIYRRNAYDAISRLIDKGLCFQIVSAAENKYNAVDPDKLTELFAEKQQKLQSILPDLEHKFAKRVAPEEAYIYRGLEGQKNIWRDVLRVGQTNYIMGAKGGWFDLKLEANRTAFLKEAHRRKIKFYQIFDYEITKHKEFLKNWPDILEYRFFPKEYSTNSVIHVFGDYIVSYTGLELFRTHENIVFFILHSKNLAESYRKWFWYFWKRSSEKIK